MRRCLVTGGAGFIGSHVVRGLLARGDRVRVIDNLSTGREANLADVRERIEFFTTDICDPAGLAERMREIDVVFHLAAIGSVPRSVEQPRQTHDANTGGTFNVLVAAREAGVQRVIYSGSSSAYGDTPTLPKREDMLPLPLSPYAASKLAGEHYCRSFAKVYGMHTISLRYFNVFGPRQDPKSAYAAAIPAFVSRMLKGAPPVIFGDGEQSRDFCFVENVVAANLLASDARELRGEAVNIACGERITLNAIISLLNELLGTNLKPDYKPARIGDVKHSLADLALARQVIGYEPRVMFNDGLRRSLEWYRANL